jgi:chromosome segregation ATPase
VSDTDDSAILKAIQDLRSDVIGELQAQRQLWGEAEATLLAQGKLHRERLDEHESEIAELKASDADHGDQISEIRRKYHALCSKLQPLFTDVEDVKLRMGEIERLVRKDGGAQGADG